MGAGSVARRPVGRNRIEPLLQALRISGRSCAETRIDAHGPGPLDRTECDNGGSRDGLGASTEPSTENLTGPSAITAGRGAVIRCLTAKHQPGRAMTRRGRNLWSRGVRSGQLGSVPAPAASLARGFNPGHAPHRRGTAVTPLGLGRENPGGLGGPVCAAGRDCSPLQRTKAPQGVRGEMRPVSSAGWPAPHFLVQ